MATSPYSAVPFTNDWKQTIQPGDKIVAVTGSGSLGSNLRVGWYLGVRNNRVVMKMQRMGTMLKNAAGELYDFTAENALPYPEMPSPLDPNFEIKMQQYRFELAARQAKVNAYRHGYTYQPHPYYVVATLRSNRIYPANVAELMLP